MFRLILVPFNYGEVNLGVQIESQMPEEVKVMMEQAAIDLLNSGIYDRSLKTGDKIPNFALPNAIAELVDIHELLKSSLVVISFYRGGWCPYCNLELRSLQQALPQINTYGGTLVAISPQTPIILFGEIWTTLMLWLETEVLERKFFNSHDMHNIFHLTSVTEVIDLINRVHRDRFQMEHVCVNYSKYRQDLSFARFLEE